MAKPRSLKNAPITEAIIDVRTERSLSPDEGLFGRIADRVQYKLRKDLAEAKVVIRFDKGDPVIKTSPAKANGLRLESENGFVAILRTNGFSLSKLAPYSSWEALLAEFERIFSIYNSEIPLPSIDRVGVRFINRLPIPLDSVGDFSPILTRPPTSPEPEPTLLTGFDYLNQLYIPGKRISINIRQKVQSGPIQEMKVPLIIDIDVSKKDNLSPHFESVRHDLSDLRDIKNHYFFDSLTELALSYFQ